MNMCLTQSLAHSSCSINISSLNGWDFGETVYRSMTFELSYKGSVEVLANVGRRDRLPLRNYVQKEKVVNKKTQ